MELTWHRHLGVYGICINEKNEMMVIYKNGGPYTGRYDLPGGTLQNPESINECLIREMFEETNSTIKVEKNLGAYDFLVKAPYNGALFTHHIALLYEISIDKQFDRELAVNLVENGENIENDAISVEWININELSESNSSPLVIKAIEIITNSMINYIMKEYRDWESKKL